MTEFEHTPTSTETFSVFCSECKHEHEIPKNKLVEWTELEQSKCQQCGAEIFHGVRMAPFRVEIIDPDHVINLVSTHD